MKKNTNKNVASKNENKKPGVLSNKPILHITIKAFIVIAIISSAIFYVDNKGYFNRDSSNAHVIKRWNAFYEFNKKNDVDVILFGDSHLFTGINPKNLSSALGANSFILAAPTAKIADTYFALQEALKISDPKLVIIETYGIDNSTPYTLSAGALSNQIRSFHARKDLITKIKSTPFLFKSDNYLYAWSPTLRNHEYIFKDTLQLARNKAIIKQKPKKDNKLHLGRFVRFTKGIDASTLAKYDSLGAPVIGDNYSYSEYAEMYLQKIVELCENNDIQLMFLTIPMYHKHIDNYQAWKQELNKLLGKYQYKWLDLQDPYDSVKFTTVCFENSYHYNQHLTYNGSLIATYKLANFIKSNPDIKLPNRKNDTKWKMVFYGQEGYFENNPVLANDEVNKLICENFVTNNIMLKEVSTIRSGMGENQMIIAKIPREKVDLSECKLRLTVSFINNGKIEIANIDLNYDTFHKTPDMYIFKTMLKPIKIEEVKAGGIICNQELQY